jgi:hypothetical protein
VSIKNHVFSWELEPLSPSEHFLHLSGGYLESSIHLFEALADGSLSGTFSHARAAAFLFEHSVELFLKGAILRARGRVTSTHRLDDLHNEFRNLYPGKKFHFAGSIEDIVTPNSDRPYPQFSRYPVDSTGEPWRRCSVHLDLGTWLEELSQFKEDYNRLWPLLKSRYPSDASLRQPDTT